MQIRFAKLFGKQYDKANQKIKSEFDSRLKLFREDRFHPQLNNHALTGRYKEKRSINITGDWRAVYSETSEVIIFELLGTHSQLYK